MGHSWLDILCFRSIQSHLAFKPSWLPHTLAGLGVTLSIKAHKVRLHWTQKSAAHYAEIAVVVTSTLVLYEGLTQSGCFPNEWPNAENCTGEDPKLVFVPCCSTQSLSFTFPPHQSAGIRKPGPLGGSEWVSEWYKCGPAFKIPTTFENLERNNLTAQNNNTITC